MKETAALRRRILSRSAPLAVIGQGQAGLSLAFGAADAGFKVTAIDENQSRIQDLQRGALRVPGVSERALTSGLASDRLTFSADLELVQKSDVVAICVPMPIRDQTADLGSLQDTCRQLGRYLRPGQLVIVELTSSPGTTEELVMPALETSGLSANHDFLLAYSPERVDPGTEPHELSSTPRIVGGMTREATGVAALFFGQFVDKVVQVSSCRAAEMAKLLENTYRQVNVGLVNEMARFCNEQGIDVWEVIDASIIKRFGFMPFDSGEDVGGNGAPASRIPSDGQNSDAAPGLRLLNEARAINSEMPEYVAARIERSLNDRGRTVGGARILALGVTHQPEVGEVVDSAAVQVIRHLKTMGAKVAFHDPNVPELMVNGDLLARSLLTERSVETADCVAILTPHSAYDLDWIASHARMIFDASNAFGPDRRPNVRTL